MKHEVTLLVLIGYLHTVTGQGDCHCVDKSGCPNICNSQCQPGFSGPSCHAANIAVGKTASFSRGTTPLRGAPEQTVDGNTADSNCPSVRGSNPRWEIRFGETRTFTKFKIFWSSAELPTGILAIIVDSSTCTTSNGTTQREVTYTCFAPQQGDSVMIIMQAANTTLTMCEVEIYECMDGYYELNCSSCNCNGGTNCDKVTGVCDQPGQGDCRCLDKSSCPNNCNSQCEPGFSGPSCHAANIAVGKTASFSRGTTSLRGTPEQTVDGNTADSNCPSVRGSNPRWEIRFGETRTVTRVKIFWSSAELPMGILVITVDSYSCATSPSTQREVTYTCFQPLLGDSVMIIIQAQTTTLTLCEVEIYECMDGYYGLNCFSCNCNGGTNCDKVTGFCDQHVTTTTTSTLSQSTTPTTTTPTTTTTTTTTASTTPNPTTTSSAPPTTSFTASSGSSTTPKAPDTTATGKSIGTSTVKSLDDENAKRNVAGSGKVKVFDLIESRFPASIQGGPSVTTDGNTSLASCVIINGTQPSWKVTLDKQHVIYGLKLYLPYSADLTDFSVQVAGSVCYQRSSSAPVPTPYMFQCYEQMTGDSVTVYVPQSDRTVSLALCEVEVFGKSIDTKGLPVAAIVVPCVIVAAVVVVVIVVLVVKRRKWDMCVKSKDEPVEPHYAGLEPKPEVIYSTLTPTPDKNEPRPYENEQIQLGGRHTYANTAGDNE